LSSEKQIDAILNVHRVHSVNSDINKEITNPSKSSVHR